MTWPNNAATAVPASRGDDAAVPVTALAAAARAHLANGPAPQADGRAAAIEAAVQHAIADYNRDRLDAKQPALTAAARRRLRSALEAQLGDLGALAPLLVDESIEDIWANGCDNVWVTRYDDTRERIAPIADSDQALVDLIRRIVAASGADGERRFDTAVPEVNFQLADGSRLHAIMAVADRPSLSIRRHRLVEATLEQLRDGGMFSAEIGQFLAAAVGAKFNVIVSGPFRSGKTTLVGAMAGLLPGDERLVTIEDARELGLHTDSRHHNVVSLQTRDANIEGSGAITAAALFRAAQRMSPDRIIVGEVRGPEVRVMLEAMSTGTDGSLSTLHTSSSSGVFSKIKSFARDGGLDAQAAAEKIAEGLDLVVQLRRTPQTGRIITSIREVRDADGAMIASNELWGPGPDGRAVPQTPISAERAERLAEAGWRPAPGRWGR